MEPNSMPLSKLATRLILSEVGIRHLISLSDDRPTTYLCTSPVATAKMNTAGDYLFIDLRAVATCTCPAEHNHHWCAGPVCSMHSYRFCV